MVNIPHAREGGLLERLCWGCGSGSSFRGMNGSTEGVLYPQQYPQHYPQHYPCNIHMQNSGQSLLLLVFICLSPSNPTSYPRRLQLKKLNAFCVLCWPLLTVSARFCASLAVAAASTIVLSHSPISSSTRCAYD